MVLFQSGDWVRNLWQSGRPVADHMFHAHKTITAGNILKRLKVVYLDISGTAFHMIYELVLDTSQDWIRNESGLESN